MFPGPYTSIRVYNNVVCLTRLCTTCFDAVRTWTFYTISNYVNPKAHLPNTSSYSRYVVRKQVHEWRRLTDNAYSLDSSYCVVVSWEQSSQFLIPNGECVFDSQGRLKLLIRMGAILSKN